MPEGYASLSVSLSLFLLLCMKRAGFHKRLPFHLSMFMSFRVFEYCEPMVIVAFFYECWFLHLHIICLHQARYFEPCYLCVYCTSMFNLCIVFCSGHVFVYVKFAYHRIWLLSVLLKCDDRFAWTAWKDLIIPSVLLCFSSLSCCFEYSATNSSLFWPKFLGR